MTPRIDLDQRQALPLGVGGYMPMHLRERLKDGAIRLLPGLAPDIVRPRGAPVAASLGRVGSLEVRLARTAKEVRRAQRLRYQVFYDEMSAVPNAAAMISRRDVDEYDALCDHLLVLDHDVKPKPFRAHKPKVVGTYRLLGQETAQRHAGFYTAGEFEIAPLLEAHAGKRFLELGRSCVLKPYRSKKTVELLWQGLWAYVLANRVDAMIGCASLEGTDPNRLALPLGFLHHFARSPAAWRVEAQIGRRLAMDPLPREAIDVKAAMRMLPPLIKAYLRLGATFGDGAVVDHQFGTTDVFVVMPVEAISGRYIEYFGPAANRYAA